MPSNETVAMPRVLTARQARLAMLGLAAAVDLPACAAGIGGSIGLVSDQVYRGVSVTAGRAALLTELNYVTDTGWSASLGSTWAHVDAPARVAQWRFAAGRAWQLDDDSAAHLNYVHRAYPGGGRPRYDATYGDQDELSASVDWQGRWFVTLAVSPRVNVRIAPDRFRSAPAVSYELGYRQRLRGRLALDIGLGYTDPHAAPNGGYVYGSVGVSGGIGPVQTSLTWLGSRAAEKQLAPASAAGRRWVAAAIWSF